ncbi:hypothetical protein [Halobacteriovorax sp.]|uniref:hypothetical protein n=1 Tax=Halobacteriovorax sp. TaxID=2020862 RepID=UPI003565B0DA
MFIQFILKLIFFYFLYTFMRSLLRGYLSKKATANGAYQNNNRSNHEESRRRQQAPSGDIFEAEYKVVKEES